ncbi:MAG: Rid family detoxifying hydrolase [Clostridia bacterium]|nr:Rid family detoxifying hydrolase [Clostridia bacterium]
MEKICFKTKKGPAAVGPYSTATICGGTIYLSGMIGVDPAVQKPVEGGTLAQARQVFENIVTVLGELGATTADVLKTTVYLTDIGDFAEVNKLYAEYFGPDYPARTCVEVSRLPMGLSIEVECIAQAKA